MPLNPISAVALTLSAAAASAHPGNKPVSERIPQSGIWPLMDGFAIIDAVPKNGSTERQQPLVKVGAAVILDRLLPSPRDLVPTGERP